MKALVFHGPHDMKLEELPKPKAGPGEAVVKILLSGICGTDLHIYHGEEAVAAPLVLGHEPVGVVDELGEGVCGFKVGDRVAISCITRCGTCYNCQRQRNFNCENGGWILGNTENGSHAQYMRVKYPQEGMYKIPDDLTNEQVLLLGDAMSTGYKGAENGDIIPGDTVVIYGAGPIGTCAMFAAKLWTPSKVIMVDMLPERLEFAKAHGADGVINARDKDPVEEVKRLTNGKGAEVAIEAIGIEKTMWQACESIRPGGNVSILGVAVEPIRLPLDKILFTGANIKIGPLSTANVPQLMDLVAKGVLDLTPLITHEFPIDDALEAFETFAQRKDGAIKVALKPWG